MASPLNDNDRLFLRGLRTPTAFEDIAERLQEARRGRNLSEVRRLEQVQRQINEQAILIGRAQALMADNRVLTIPDRNRFVSDPPGFGSLNFDYADIEQRAMYRLQGAQEPVTFGHIAERIREITRQEEDPRDAEGGYDQNPWSQNPWGLQSREPQPTSFAGISAEAVDGFMYEMRNTVSAAMYGQNRREPPPPPPFTFSYMGMEVLADPYCERDTVYLMTSGSSTPTPIQRMGINSDSRSSIEYAIEEMRLSSFGGPYTIVMSPQSFAALQAATGYKSPPPPFIMAKAGKAFEDKLDEVLQAFSEGA
jgi:hypothetical protein